MLRPLMKIAALLIVLFVMSMGAVMGIAYTQERQRLDEIRAFLMPWEGCPMPCIMVIRPGFTTPEAAIEILTNHEWVGDVHFQDIEDGTNITWNWSGLQPSFINGTSGGLMVQINTFTTITDFIVVLSIRHYDMLSIFGQTEYASLYTEATSSNLNYRFNYPMMQTSIIAVVYCPMNPIAYWEASTTLRVSVFQGGSTFIPPKKIFDVC